MTTERDKGVDYELYQQHLMRERIKEASETLDARGIRKARMRGTLSTLPSDAPKPPPIHSLVVEHHDHTDDVHHHATESVPASEPHRGLSDSVIFQHSRLAITAAIVVVLFLVWIGQRTRGRGR